MADERAAQKLGLLRDARPMRTKSILQFYNLAPPASRPRNHTQR
jgi:hypothetical protein